MTLSVKKKVLNWVEPWVELATFGLDISDLAVKYVKFRKGNSGDTELFGEVALPPGLIENGEIKKEEELSRILTSWFSGEGKELRPYFATVSLPEEKGFLRLIQLPKVKRDEVASAVRWEMEGNIPLPLEELVYDYEVIEPEDPFDHLDVMIAAFPKTILELYVRVLKSAGLRPWALELESQAVVRALFPFLANGDAKIVLDIGRSRTGLIVVAGNTVIYTTTFSFGGRLLEENLMRNLNISAAEALAVKKETGLDLRAYEGKLMEVFLPVLSPLSDEINRAVIFYQSHPSHVHGVSGFVKEILLVGGDANLLGLETYLSSSLKIPARAVDFRRVLSPRPTSIPEIPKNESLGYATAIGLALRSAGNY